MTEKIQPLGLCVNCLIADDCGYRVNHKKPIIFCEEFSCSESKTFQSEKQLFDEPGKLLININKIIGKGNHSINPNPKGICSNCVNIETCALQRNEDIINNCEEYR